MHSKAQNGGFVVWNALILPTELFFGFENVVVVLPENHSAMSAAKGLGVQVAEKAEQEGYHIDLCSYARIDIGSSLSEYRFSPSGGLPPTDLLISDTNNCSMIAKWFDIYHREKGVPHFILDVPFCYEPQKEKDLAYLINQFKDLIELIEKMSGQHFDIEKVRAALVNTNVALKYWKRFLGLAAHRPSAISAFDTFAHMAAYVLARGTTDLIDYYSSLVDKTKERIEQQSYPVPNERYRLLWDQIAPWHRLRHLFEKLKTLNANIVYGTYTSCIGTIEGGFDLYEYDEKIHPLAYLARIQNFSVCPYGLDLRLNAMSQIIERIGIDGIIFASNKSCKPYSVMQMDLKERMCEKYNIPAVMIELDHADARAYNEHMFFENIEILLEMIEGGTLSHWHR